MTETLNCLALWFVLSLPAALLVGVVLRASHTEIH